MLSLATATTVLIAGFSANAHPLAAPEVTSLTDKSVRFEVPAAQHFAVLERGGVRAIVVDNDAGDRPLLSEHRGGYNGVASLSHRDRSQNVFVPTYAGLNFEHIHDGTLSIQKEKFEPRRSPMQLRVIDENTVELYQPPTPNWKLESCGRYHMLPDGTLEYTFECIPRADLFRGGFIGLFWASYIQAPEDKAIFFQGREADGDGAGEWIRAVTPRHGVNSTHPPIGPLPNLAIDPKFPLTLVPNRSPYVYTQPWYYGINHGMAYVAMFRSQDRIWFAQSPTGGGAKNPAWDFQWFIPDYKVDEAYGFVMRLAYKPFESREQLIEATRVHREALNPSPVPGS